MIRDRRGYTLVELIVVVLLIGVLAAFGIPEYIKTVETGKADDAASIVNQIGMTNRMYALDHSGCFASGAFAGSCTSTCCPGSPACPVASWSPCPAIAACALVACRYLSDQDWSNKPYRFFACRNTATCGTRTAPVGTTLMAVANRTGSSITTYNGWGYSMNNAGRITAYDGAPTPAY